MITEEELKESVNNFILNRGFLLDPESDSYKIIQSKRGTGFKSLTQVSSFFKVRGYQYRGQDLINTTFKKTLRIAGIQRYSLEEPPKGFIIDNYYCCRFQDLGESKDHLPGFFMTGLHDFNITSTSNFLFHLESLLDFFRGSSITEIKWDNWTDGRNKGPSVEFFSNGLQIANMVFTLKDSKGNLLKRPYLDAGIGLSRYLSLQEEGSLGVSTRARVLLFLVFCSTLGITPGRRGVEDNLKRVYRSIKEVYTQQQLRLAQKEWSSNNPASKLVFDSATLDSINRNITKA